MRAGWEGNHRLQAFVRAADSGVGLIAEVVEVEGATVLSTKDEWGDLTPSSGSVERLDRGAIQIAGTTSVLAEHTTEDGTQVTALAASTPFDAIILTHLGGNAESRELHTLTVRLDPRANGANPKTVDHFIAEAYRISEEVGSEGIVVELIARSGQVTASGEVAALFAFSFAQPSGRRPNVGPPPKNGLSQPKTLFRIIPYQADGSVADNVAWLADSAEGGSKTNSSTYQVDHYSIIASTGQQQLEQGGSVWEVGGAVNNMPYFSLSRRSYAQAVVGIVGDEPVADITGSGDLVVRARGEEWGDSSLTFQVHDGSSSWVDCVDGDVLGLDNRVTIEGVQYGSDLSTIPTTGPWNLRLILDPSTDGLRTPVGIDFGIERIVATSLAGAARVSGGERTLDPVDMRASIPTAVIDILKTGDLDYRDFGTELLSTNFVGDLELRVWVGDPSEQYLHRSEWMLHSVWDIEDYDSLDESHQLDCISPLKVLATTELPPFEATSAFDGTRTATEVSGTLKAVWDELVDSFAGLSARRRGPGMENIGHSIKKLLTKGTVKEALDQVAYLDGRANVESQGKLKAVHIMRDEPLDYIVARFGIGEYTPRRITPGLSSRTDEFFLRYNWEESSQRFENERRYLIATAEARLGGAGLKATRRLEEEISKWIISEGLADAVGDRIPKHLAYGAILWAIDPNEKNPQLEQGDIIVVEVDRFVARSPITLEPLRGRLRVQAVVVDVNDFWGQSLRVWVPGYEYISVSQGTINYDILIDGRYRGVFHLDTTTRPTSGTAPNDLATVTLPAHIIGANGVLKITAVFDVSGTNANKTVAVDVRLDGGGSAQTLLAQSIGVSDTGRVEIEIIFANSGSETAQYAYSNVVTDIAGISAKGTPLTLARDTTLPIEIVFWGDVDHASDTVELEVSRIEHIGEAAA